MISQAAGQEGKQVGRKVANRRSKHRQAEKKTGRQPKQT